VVLPWGALRLARAVGYSPRAQRASVAAVLVLAALSAYMHLALSGLHQVATFYGSWPAMVAVVAGLRGRGGRPLSAPGRRGGDHWRGRSVQRHGGARGGGGVCGASSLQWRFAPSGGALDGDGQRDGAGGQRLVARAVPARMEPANPLGGTASRHLVRPREVAADRTGSPGRGGRLVGAQ